MIRHIVACSIAIATVGVVAHAQGPRPPIDIMGVEPLEFDAVVTGAPFTAEAVTESTQELRDGNRIERRSNTTIARDGLGRVRREQDLPSLGPIAVDPDVRLVTISDPRQRVMYLIDQARKTVSRSGPPPGGPRLGRGPGGPGEPRGRGFGGGRERGPQPPLQVTSENLGTRQVAGVRADGTRQTVTFPAGAFGNVRAIEVVTERWYSPELKITVESRRMDPRLGDVVYRVVSLIRAEPPPDLFEIPADYTVVDGPMRPGPPGNRPPRGDGPR
jgi:hypothetical protein